MPDISALSLQSALLPSAGPVTTAPLENAGNTGEQGADATAPRFDAVLAQQAMQAATKAAAPDLAAAILPEDGKTLPDAANPLPAGIVEAMMTKVAFPQTRSGRTEAPDVQRPALIQDPTEGLAEDMGGEALVLADDADIMPVPDIALFAAIFAAPERLTHGPAEMRVSAPQAQLATQNQSGVAAGVAALAAVPTPQAMPTIAAAAIAGTAQIELIASTPKGAVPRTAQLTAPALAAAGAVVSDSAPEPVGGFADAMAAGPDAPSAAPVARAVPIVLGAQPGTERAAKVPADNFAAPLAKGAAAPTLQPGDSAQPGTGNGADPIATLVALDAPTQADGQPSVGIARAEARAERIDFATLVDTLNRAREDASPRTLNVAVTNTDFGRVSMRFDSSDAGLSVAMSAADPGFARAITASSESASTSSDTRGQNGQNPADASAARHQQGQNPQQHQAATAGSDARIAANAATDTLRVDDAAAASASATASGGDSGIYA